jgi:ankyrin repeat protein
MMPHTQLTLIASIQSPSIRANKYVCVARLVDGPLFDKIIQIIKELDAIPANGYYRMNELLYAPTARQKALDGIFEILMFRAKYEKAFTFVQSSFTSPLRRAKYLLKLAMATRYGAVFEDIVKAAENLNEVTTDGKFLRLERREIKPARALLKETLQRMTQDINYQDETKGHTCLHKAAMNNNIKEIKKFLDRGADIKIVDKAYKTPLHKAVKYGGTEIVIVLLGAGAEINAKSSFANTPLHLAVKRKKNIEMIKILLEAGADGTTVNGDDYTPLHIAAKLNEAQAVMILLDSGIPIDIKNDRNDTPLHEASCAGSTESVQILLDRGAQVNIQEDDGKTPLHLAIMGNDIKTIKALLAVKYIQVDIQDIEFKTALHIAAEQKSTDAIQLLLSKGARTDLKDKNGDTPLHVAAQVDCPEAVSFLLEKNSKIGAADIKNRNGKTALDEALQKNHFKTAQALLNAGASIEIRDAFGYTPLLNAVANGKEETVKFLLDQGAEINTLGRGRTPLHIAAKAGHASIVALLLSHPKIQVDLKDGQGCTAYECTSNAEIKQLIQAKSSLN